MSRSRNIKPGFFRNEILSELPFEHRLLFIGIWTEADREGRLEYRARRLKAAVFPYDDRVDVEDGVAALAEGGFLRVYEANGSEYIQVSNWAKHQNPHHKEVGSTIPAPAGHKDTVCDGYIPLSNTIRQRIYARDGRVCRACGATHGLSIDHIIPVSKGGNSVDDNLQVLCLGCNARKSNNILVHMPSKGHARTVDDSSKSLHVPLIPDSLIPDSPSLIPDSLCEEANASLSAASPPTCPHQQIVALYHEHLPANPRIKIWDGARAATLQARWREDPKRQSAEYWGRFFRHCAGSKFLTGQVEDRGGRPFLPGLDWLVKASNFAKIIEGRYHERGQQ